MKYQASKQASSKKRQLDRVMGTDAGEDLLCY